MFRREAYTRLPALNTGVLLPPGFSKNQMPLYGLHGQSTSKSRSPSPSQSVGIGHAQSPTPRSTTNPGLLYLIRTRSAAGSRHDEASNTHEMYLDRGTTECGIYKAKIKLRSATEFTYYKNRWTLQYAYLFLFATCLSRERKQLWLFKINIRMLREYAAGQL